MREILEQIAFEARLVGVDAQVVDGRFPDGDDIAYVVVPHEYFIVRPPELWPSAAALSRTIALTVEHPGTPWFDITAEHAGRCAMIMDINADSTAELRRRGLQVLPFQLGYCSYNDRWRQSGEPRPIDVVYLGSSDARRDAALASCARWWTGRRVSLLMPSEAPRTTASESYLIGDDKYHLLRRSRILVNLHRGTSRSLEWVRILEAMSNGAVVVSEHSVDSAPLIAGEHFLAADPDSIGLLVHQLLEDDDRLNALRDSAYEFIRHQLPLSRSVAQLLAVCAELVRNPRKPGHRSVPPPTPSSAPLPWQTAELQVRLRNSGPS